MSGLATTTNLYTGCITKWYPNFSQKRQFFKKLFSKCKEKSSECPKLDQCSRIESRGMSLPLVGIGTWQVEPDCIDSVISYALDVGYRHIDTSHSYGNQGPIGATLDKLFKCGKYCRSEIFISAKLPYYAMNPDVVCSYVTDSLNCLGLSYIDLYMIHFPVGIKQVNGEYSTDPETNHIHIWKALEEEVSKGTIRSLGVSNFNVAQIRSLMECAKIPPANVQIEMHLYLQQRDIRDYCSKQCISVTAYAPLGSPGLDQYLMQNCLKSAGVPCPLNDHSAHMIACKHKKTPSQVLLRFLLQNGVAVIPKSSKPDRICKNFDLFNFELDSCEMEELCQKDLGEKGRMFGSNVWVGTEKHPLYPFMPIC